jgi:hypothetical protein
VALPSGATRVSFWAAADRQGQNVRFYVRSAGNNPAFLVETAFTLGTTLAQYALEFPAGATYPPVLSGFGWVAENGDLHPVKLYVDDIRWE